MPPSVGAQYLSEFRKNQRRRARCFSLAAPGGPLSELHGGCSCGRWPTREVRRDVEVAKNPDVSGLDASVALSNNPVPPAGGYRSRPGRPAIASPAGLRIHERAALATTSFLCRDAIGLLGFGPPLQPAATSLSRPGADEFTPGRTTTCREVPKGTATRGFRFCRATSETRGAEKARCPSVYIADFTSTPTLPQGLTAGRPARPERRTLHKHRGRG